MKRRQYVALSIILGLNLIGASQPALANACEFDEIAIFATNSIRIGTGTVVTGNVVANNASPGPVLDEGVELALDRNAAITGDATAVSVDLDNGASVSGTLTCDTGDAACTGLVPPVFAAGDIPVFLEADVRPDADDVFVAAGATVVLGDEGFCSETTTTECSVVLAGCPGTETCVPGPVTSYGDIVVNQGGTLVFFGGGRFDVRSITGTSTAGQCSPCRSIEFDAPTELRIEGRFDSERGAYVGPSAGSGIAASDITIDIGGQNGATGGLFEEPWAVNIGRESEVHASFSVPYGTFQLDKDSTMHGAVLASDVDIKKNSTFTGDSAFANQTPTAVAQDVLTDGASDLVITLEGSDPEGADLSFSIEVDPAEGTLGAISPVTPATVDQCSQSGVACNVDSDCPGFAEGETCETVQPSVTQATVTYTPDLNGNCVTDPESGEVTCPEDFFTFGVTDPCGALGTAIVSVNGGTDEVPDDPGAGVDSVEANDLEVDAVVNDVRVITLSAAAPGTVTSLTFRVETLPTGALQDSNGATVVAAGDLPSPVVTYQAPASTGTDSFTFSARDSTTIAPPCGPPSCDTGTVNIDIGNLPELAPDQSVGTDLNTPVEITLRANSGGTSGTPPPMSSVVTKVTYGDNGPPMTEAQLNRLAELRGGSATRATALGVDQGWNQFSWCDGATSPGCDDLFDLVNESPAIEGPFDFTTTETSCLRVTDALAKGDHWRVESLAGGNVDWTDFTSEVDQSTVGTTGDPDVAFGDLSYSHGAFDLSPGTFSIQLITIPPDSFAFGTAGYIRVDTGPCVDIVWTITSLPAAGTGTLTNLNGSLVQIGDIYFAEPTVVFTPAFNFIGPTAFQYQVAQGGTVGTAVVDTAIIDLLVSSTDPCVLVGRDPGCAPGLFGQSQGGTESAGYYVSELSASDGPSDGLTFIVEGRGTVSSSPVPLADDRILMGLNCSSECTKEFPVGSVIRVFARPDGDSEFVGWDGDCRGEGQIGTAQLAKQTLCKATFREKASE